MQVVVDTTFSGIDITSAATVHTYTAPADDTYRFQVELRGVAGNGDYVAHLTLNDGGADTDAVIGPRTTYTAEAGETSFWFASIDIDAVADDVIKIWMLGQAGDNNEDGTIRIFRAPTVDSFQIGQDLTIGVAQTIAFVLVDGSGTPVTGLGNTFTLEISKAGGAFAASTGTKAEIASGWYTYEFVAAEANTAGPLAVRVTDASIQTQNLEYVVVNRQVGAIQFTYTVTDVGTGLPIDNVKVWITTDVAGTNTVWSGFTDAFGIAYDADGNLPMLDGGTYAFWTEKVGYSFTNPDLELVS